jgi:hypothetical protein
VYTKSGAQYGKQPLGHSNGSFNIKNEKIAKGDRKQAIGQQLP